MNLRHAAALGLVGWYLMVPPLKNGEIIPDEKAPLSEWKTVMSGNSSLFCERVRIVFQNRERPKPLESAAAGMELEP